MLVLNFKDVQLSQPSGCILDICMFSISCVKHIINNIIFVLTLGLILAALNSIWLSGVLFLESALFSFLCVPIFYTNFSAPTQYIIPILLQYSIIAYLFVSAFRLLEVKTFLKNEPLASQMGAITGSLGILCITGIISSVSVLLLCPYTMQILSSLHPVLVVIITFFTFYATFEYPYKLFLKRNKRLCIFQKIFS